MEHQRGSDISALRNYSNLACREETEFLLKAYGDFCTEAFGEWKTLDELTSRSFDQYLMKFHLRSKKIEVSVKSIPPGFYYAEYDPELIDPENICLSDSDAAKMKAAGYYGGLLFPKGAVDFKSLTDEQLSAAGLMKIPQKENSHG